MSERKFYVYEHWRPDKDVCFYVGKGSGKRAHDMCIGRNRYHKNVQAKLARTGFCVEVRLVAQALTEREAFDIEIERIAFWRSVGVKLANITSGGDGASGHKRSAADRKKLSKAAKRRVKNPKYIEKLRAATTRSWAENPGRRENQSRAMKDRPKRKTGPPSAETRAKISAANMGRKGIARTPEQRAAVSAKLKGRVFSEEHCAKISAAKKGVRASPEHRAAMAVAARPIPDWIREMGPLSCCRAVVCLDDGQRFDSIKSAAAHYDVSAGLISAVCRREPHRKTAGGFRFHFEDE